jgi:hypothetical protein
VGTKGKSADFLCNDEGERSGMWRMKRKMSGEKEREGKGLLPTTARFVERETTPTSSLRDKCLATKWLDLEMVLNLERKGAILDLAVSCPLVSC